MPILLFSWKKISAEIQKTISANDIIMIILSRPGRIAWRLGFERMPTHLVKQFSTYNMISVYPRFHSDDIEDETDYFKRRTHAAKIQFPNLTSYF